MGDRGPQPGAVLVNKYVVESVLGAGGMGVVVKARHLALDEAVAIKCLLPELQRDPEVLARFLREATSAVKLKNEHVARVLDVGQFENEDRTPYIVMEYLAGGDLAGYLATHAPVPIGTVIDLLLQACEALAEAHSLGIIHRDIKPSNFALAGLDDPPLLKVLDFGIATAPDGGGNLTMTDSVLGTPLYMAPEQMRSMKTADERSDLWSLGVVAYELIENARPFRGDAYAALCLAIAMDPPAPMTRASPALSAVILRCLEKDPDRRFQTISELAAALVPFAVERARAETMAGECARLLRRTPTPRRVAKASTEAATVPAKPVREPRKSRAWIVALGAVVIAGGVLGVTRPWERSSAAKPPSEQVVHEAAPPAPRPPPRPTIDAKATLAAIRSSLWEGDGKAATLATAAIDALTGRDQAEARMLLGDALFEDERYRRAKTTYEAALAGADPELQTLLEERIRECKKKLRHRDNGDR